MKKDDILRKYIKEFDASNKHSEIYKPIINGHPYFIKVVGENKKEHMKNEVKSIKELAKIFPMYRDYLIAFVEEKNNCALMLRYIDGEDLKTLFNYPLTEKDIICLYKMLLIKIKFFHDNNITHGDIKPQNFISYVDEHDGIMKLKIIDTETCVFYSKLKHIDDIKRLRSLYYYLPDNPRSTSFYKTKQEAFYYFRYLDNYSLACFILYLLKPDVYKMLRKNTYKEDDKNPWRFSETDIRTPYQYVNKKGGVLENALHYVFKQIPTEEQYDFLEEFDEDKLFHLLE